MIILLDTIVHYGLPGVIHYIIMTVVGSNGVFFTYLYSMSNGAGVLIT